MLRDIAPDSVRSVTAAHFKSVTSIAEGMALRLVCQFRHGTAWLPTSS